MEFLENNEVEPKENDYSMRTLVVTSALISALVGTVFGYYGTSLLNIDTSSQSRFNLSDEEESSRVVSIVKQASPAVVSIVATQEVAIQPSSSRFSTLCEDPFFRQFFDDCESLPNQNSIQTQEVAAGTGFIIESDGLILTNKHVVNIENAQFIVILNNGKRYPATVTALDPVQDIALIKIQGNNFPTVNVGDSSKTAVGETVIAIGNALGEFNNTVSKGIVSGLSRSITARTGASSEKLEEVIQTDAAINPGNSGGPLLNLDGEVIGINTAIVSGAQSVGFAIPINQAKRDIEQVERFGKIRYAYLGVRYILIDALVQQERGLSVDYGAWVIKGTDDFAAVLPGSPAEKAGIRENDVILEIDGEKITFENTLAEAIQSRDPGDTIQMMVRRGSDTIRLSATLGEQNDR